MSRLARNSRDPLFRRLGDRSHRGCSLSSVAIDNVKSWLRPPFRSSVRLFDLKNVDGSAGKMHMKDKLMRTFLQSYVRPAYGKTRRWILSQLEMRAPREKPRAAEQTREVLIEGIRYPLKVRVGTSDARAMADCLLDMQYDIDPGFEPRTVLDLGGNIGCSAIYFANRWPDAKIVVVEPVSATFAILKQNTSFYPNIIPVHAAAHPRRETVQLVVPKKGFWAASVVGTGASDALDSNSARGVPVEDLMSEYGMERVDILKIDIEGSEADLFANNPHPWLSRTRLMMIELHDNVRMGCTWHLERALKPYKTRKGHINENLLVWLEGSNT